MEHLNTENTQDSRPLTNREMAAILFNIATCLREAGNVNPWRTAAYERGARALMGLADEASEILEHDERVPFRRRQHIGKKLQAKIREMAATGALDQYANMLADLPPHRAELMKVPGIGPKTADAVYRSLGVATQTELVRAARDGRLRAVPGFGPKRTAEIANLPVAAPTWDLFTLPDALPRAA
jgi:DNA polymerase (family 10)